MAALVAQATGEPDPNAQAWERAAHVEAAERWPWLPGAIERSVAALAAAAWLGASSPESARRLASRSPRWGPRRRQGAALALLGALSPAAGGATACVLAVAGVLSCGMYSPAFLVGALTALTLLAWRAATARGPGPLPCSASAPGLTGARRLREHPWQGPRLHPRPRSQPARWGRPFSLSSHRSHRRRPATRSPQPSCQTLSHAGSWLAIAGCALGAWLASLVGGRRGGAKGVAGQAVCATVLIATQVLAARVENGGLWAAPDAAGIAVAVVCAVLVSIVISTIGPSPRHMEDE